MVAWEAEEGGEKRLVAYVVGGGKVAVKQLQEFMRRRLPECVVSLGLCMAG